MPKVRHIDFYPDDWLAGTMGMSLVDRGCYIHICALIYARGGPVDESLINDSLPDHGRTVLASIERLEKLGKIERNGSQIEVKRCSNELERAAKRLSKASENGTKGNSVRWLGVATRPDAAIAYKEQTTDNKEQTETRARRAPSATADFDVWWKE